MTKIGILNQKLIVTNDYQQFYKHFEWFFISFSNFVCKMAIAVVQANPIFKLFSEVIFIPHPS